MHVGHNTAVSETGAPMGYAFFAVSKSMNFLALIFASSIVENIQLRGTPQIINISTTDYILVSWKSS